MTTKEQKRMNYFKARVNPDTILDTYNDRQFLEVTAKNGGDIVIYRVYDDADKPDGYSVVQR